MDKPTLHGMAQRTERQKLNDARDAMRKVQSLLSAAQHLTSTEEETEMRAELLGLVEDVVARTMEAIA
ncbi:hypothetical protein WCU37_24140 [Serratia marcescens]|uniref:hypothetical protein n=1 Tax=Serratia marcescens TaxID=615 RepID=UPI002751267E|nr:hypothetical protein [Serratia marcescens]MDP8860698.1 hypothetical protein [Serratia marcescens]